MSAVEIRHRKTCRSLAQDIVRLTQLAVLAFGGLHLLSHLAQDTGPLAPVNIGPVDPIFRVCGAQPIFDEIERTACQRDPCWP